MSIYRSFFAVVLLLFTAVLPGTRFLELNLSHASDVFAAAEPQGAEMTSSEQSVPKPAYEVGENPVSECEKLTENGFYAEVYEYLYPWLTDSDVRSDSLSRGLELCRTALDALGRSAELEQLCEKTVEAHPDDWRVLETAARQYGAMPSMGVLRDGQFIRNEWAGSNTLDSSDRDRVRSLQLYTQAMPLLERDRASGKADAEQVFNFYSEFAEAYYNIPKTRWLLLTDLTKLPDYKSYPGGWYGSVYAPVDEEGNPIFYDVPESFETAQNDGQRWRFLLDRAAKSNAPQAPSILIRYACFLTSQFGTETLSEFGPLFDRNGEEDEKGTSLFDAVGSLATLGDDETIARLASGIKRFRFPDGQNPIAILRSLVDGEGDGESNIEYRRAAADELGRIYMNRSLFVKAEEVYRRLADFEIKSELPESERIAKEKLDLLTGNYGAFEPAQTMVAGTDASFVWKFRNGKNVRFRAQAVNVPKLIEDIENYLRESSNTPPQEWDNEKVRIEDIGWKLLNDPDSGRKYLDNDAADWSVDLEPAPDHHDSQVKIALPISRPGAYLVRGKMENGNSDAILLWLSDTAILKKQVQGKTFWYVADTRTGAPISDAELHFFGYIPERSSNPRTAKPGAEEPEQGKWRVKVVESTARTNQDGYTFSNIEKSDTRFRWLTVAQTVSEDGNGRFAYYGFENIWHQRLSRFDYANTCACFLSDRPLYRPNDPIHYKIRVGTARYDLQEKWTHADATAQIVITGPGGQKISEKKVKLDETGAYEGTLETDSSFKLGVYRFNVSVRSGLHWNGVGGGSVRLEEYRKPEFEVKIEAPAEPIKLGESFKAKIHADYYFGSPVTNACVKWRVTRTKADSDWYPAGRWDWLYGRGYTWLAPNADWYPGWSSWATSCPFPFYRRHRDLGPIEIVASGETELGEDGTAEIPVDTSTAALLYPNSDQAFEISAEVTDASRRMVSGSGKVTAVKKPFRVHTWTEKGFYAPNQPVRVSIQTRRIDGVPVSGKGKAAVTRLRYVQDPDDPEKLVLNETEIVSEEVNIDAAGTGTVTFVPREAGKYRFSCAVETENGIRSDGGSIISVVGSDVPSDDQGLSNPLEIVLEKSEYRPGEKARLKITTSQPRSTVLLFVRSEINSAGEPVILRLPTGTAFYDVELKDGDMPNIWIEGVTILDGHFYQDLKNVYVPPIRTVLNVEVTPDKNVYKPGERAVTRVKVTDPDGNPVSGEITAAVYDRAIDGLVKGEDVSLKKLFWDWTRHYSPQDAHTLEKMSFPIFFPQKNPMQLIGLFEGVRAEMSVMADMALPDGGAPRLGRGVAALSGAAVNAPGGVMAKAAAPTEMNGPEMVEEESDEMPAAYGGSENGTAVSGTEPVAVRSNFADTALWVGNIHADENGVAELAFTLPENVTSWKTRVWSFAPGTRVGEGEAETVTRKDLILRMQRPRFLTQNDTVVLSANVHNYAGSDRDVTVELAVDPDADGSETPSIVLGDSPASVNVSIPAGGETRVDWKVDAKTAGSVPLVMTARTDGESDGVRESIPVYLHGILKQDAVSGTIPSAEAETRSEENPGTAVFTVTVPRDRVPEQTLLTVRYSPTLAGAMIDAIPFLVKYPYGCTEQTLNRFLPTVLVQKLLADSGIDLASLKEERANLNAQELGGSDRRCLKKRLNIFGEPISDSDSPDEMDSPVYDTDKVSKLVQEGIAHLREMQCADGGWGWFGGWRESSNPYFTSLVVGGLSLGRESGAQVPDEMLGDGIAWLTVHQARECRKLKNGEEWSDSAKKEAPFDWKSEVSADDVLVFYTLSVWKHTDGSDDKEYAETLDTIGNFIWRDRVNLTPYSLALYGLALSETGENDAEKKERIDAVLRMLRQYLKTDDANQTSWLDFGKNGPYRWMWYGDSIETQAAFLRLLLRVEPSDPHAPRLVKYLLNNRKHATYWNSTRDTAFCLVAFWEYLLVSDELSGAGTVDIYVDGEKKKSESITPDNMFKLSNTLEIGSELEPGEHEVRIAYTGDGPLYYNAYMANFTLEPFIRKAGLEAEISRTYWLLTEEEEAGTDTGVGGRPTEIRVQKFKREKLEDGAAIKSGDLIEVELNVTSRNDYESILIEDRKPAGFEPVDTLSGYTGNALNAYVEYRDSRVCFFVYRLPRGTRTMTYRLRAETPGTVSALPATIEGMYAPELRGNSDEFQTTVEE